MQIIINDITITIPSTLYEFTLGQRIDFHNQYGKELHNMALSIDAMDEGMEKELEAMQFQLETALRLLSFFTNIEIEVLRDGALVESLLEVYSESLIHFFDEIDDPKHLEQIEWNGLWQLPPIVLKNGYKMTTGELFDAKQMLLNVRNYEGSRWEALLALCVIFLRQPDELYNESFLHEGSERVQLMRTLPLSVAYQVEAIFSQLSDYLDSHFGIFQPSRIKKAGKWSKEHYEQYGWVNLLKDVAKTKAFDICGSSINSIDAVRMTPLFDVLVWVSEEKSLSEARYLDQEAEWEKNRNKR